MIRLRRGDPPEILERKAEGWKRTFLAKRADVPDLRPRKEKYAHPQVLDALRAVSHSKCFYCETKLARSAQTVDHHVAVASEPAKAFEWENLNLSCHICQQPIKSVRLEDTLDPCGDIDPADHITFEDEVIRPLDGSELGRATITRYKLDQLDHEQRRWKQLKRLWKLYQGLLAEHGDVLTERHREQLRSFAEPESSHSLMFRVALGNLPRTKSTTT